MVKSDDRGEAGLAVDAAAVQLDRLWASSVARRFTPKGYAEIESDQGRRGRLPRADRLESLAKTPRRDC